MRRNSLQIKLSCTKDNLIFNEPELLPDSFVDTHNPNNVASNQLAPNIINNYTPFKGKVFEYQHYRH